MTDAFDPVAGLHATLARRETPETVAAMIGRALPEGAGPRLARRVRRVTRASIRSYFGWSSMAATFKPPVPMDRQIAKARELALLFLERRLPESDDPEEVEAFIAGFNALIGKVPGRGSFKHDRLNRQLRGEIGLDLSRRRYSKLFRMADRLERRLLAMRRAQTRHRLVLVGKAALAPDLALDDLAATCRPRPSSLITPQG